MPRRIRPVSKPVVVTDGGSDAKGTPGSSQGTALAKGGLQAKLKTARPIPPIRGKRPLPVIVTDPGSDSKRKPNPKPTKRKRPLPVVVTDPGSDAKRKYKRKAKG